MAGRIAVTLLFLMAVGMGLSGSSDIGLGDSDANRCSNSALLGCPLLDVEGLVAKVQVGDDPREVYHIHVVGEKNMDIAIRLAAGHTGLPTIPNGLVRSGAEYNKGYSWHIDPASLEFADATIDECDGLPSHVTTGQARFCPWAAKVVSVACPTEA
jgi:hypothetical protein